MKEVIMIEKVFKIDDVTVSIINPQAISKLKEKMIEFVIKNEPYREVRRREYKENYKNKLGG